MILRLLTLCSYCVIASCSVTPDNRSASPPAGTETKTTPTDTVAPSPELRKLLDSAEKLTSLTHTFKPAELQTLFAESITQVENTLGTDLSGVKLVTDDTVERKKVIAKQLKESLRLIHRVSGSPFLPDATQAIYDLDTGTIFFHPDIARRFPPEVGSSRKLAREYLRFVMLHELVHASDARNERIKLAWPSIRTMTNAAYVREGHAHYWSKAMCRQSGCQSLIRKFSQQSSRQSGQFSADYKITDFYDLGEKFIAGLFALDASGALVDSAFRQPPSNEYQILFPELYPDEASDQSIRRITNAVLTAELPWQNSDYVAHTINTMDATKFQHNATRSARKSLKQLADITIGDSAVSFVKLNTRARQNITVQVLETDTSTSAKRAYRAMLKQHAKARGIGDLYGITPQPWNTNSSSRPLNINGREIAAGYFSGTNGRSLNAKASALVSVDVALMHADRFIVRILNIDTSQHDLIDASESILRKLFSTTQAALAE